MNYNNPVNFLALTSIIGAIGVLVTPLEMLAVHSHYQNNGLFRAKLLRPALCLGIGAIEIVDIYQHDSISLT